jgi:D-alanyl-lipoteichoic acid acyltransferase DltB (MBOAT superfamily)
MTQLHHALGRPNSLPFERLDALELGLCAWVGASRYAGVWAMLFNSYVFVLGFLPITLALFFTIAKVDRRAARHFLLIASFLFYAWWSFEYGLVIVATIVVNFFLGRKIQELADHRAKMAKPLLVIAVAANVALLSYFKYRNFFIDNFNMVTGSNWEFAPLVLPLAISFHTFQQIAYLVDSYHRKVDQPPLPTYALFVLFFPQLIAGPIVHHYQLLPQLKDRRIYTFDNRPFAAGICFFVFGLAKKLLIADPLSSVADPIFNGALAQAPPLPEAWVGLCVYTLGLYFDFSGYSDMAIGLARMFGIKLPYNFDSPYKATSIIDFWRRWHMTLSNWLRDYLYIPLGGNQHGKARRYLNLMITMLLGGLWHGAAWTFVFWGLLHGLYLMIDHAWRALQSRIARDGRTIQIPAAAGWMLTFLSVSFAWVFFRSPTMAHAVAMIEGLAGLNGLHSDRLFSILGPGHLSLLALALVITLLMPNSQQLFDDAPGRTVGSGLLRLRWQPTFAWSAVAAALLLFSLTRMSTVREFVYFQF